MNQFDKRHLANVRKYQRQIDKIYRDAAAQVAARYSGLPVPDDAIFSFDEFPAVKAQIDALIRQMAGDIELTVQDGVRTEWDLSNDKNDALVDSVFGENAIAARYKHRSVDALNSFMNRKTAGLNLSDRVWNYTNQFKGEIEMGLDVGIREGLDAASMARQLQQYLVHPDMLFRRVRDEHGILRLSQRAAQYHPGQGVYRSSYKNARRLAATETNIAYRTADHDRWQQFDFVVGIRIELSNNHTCLNAKGKPVPFFDICDELQGSYPKEFKFVGWHPHCRCIATAITKTDKESEDDFRRALRGEEKSDPKDSENYVGEMPDNFKQWMEDNAERLENAKSMPYFIRDNFKDGDPSQGLMWMDDAIQPKEKVVEHYETIGDVEQKLNDVGRDWIAGVENGRFNISHSPVSNSPVAGETDGLGNLYVSGKESLIDAFNKIAQGEIDKITENEARNLETLWHEITHCRNIHFRAGNELSVMAREYMETANEWVSRKTFGDFMERLGSSKIPHPELLIDDPLNGYNAWAKGYQNFIESFGLNESKVLESLKYHLFNDEYKTMKNGLFMALEDGGLTTIDGRKLSLRQKTMLLDRIKRGFNKSWADSTAAEFGIKILR